MFEIIIVNILNLLGNTIDVMTVDISNENGGKHTSEIIDTIYKKKIKMKTIS